jgi:hypothetical protein
VHRQTLDIEVYYRRHARGMISRACKGRPPLSIRKRSRALRLTPRPAVATRHGVGIVPGGSAPGLQVAAEGFRGEQKGDSDGHCCEGLRLVRVQRAFGVEEEASSCVGQHFQRFYRFAGQP